MRYGFLTWNNYTINEDERMKVSFPKDFHYLPCQTKRVFTINNVNPRRQN